MGCGKKTHKHGRGKETESGGCQGESGAGVYEMGTITKTLGWCLCHCSVAVKRQGDKGNL